MDVITLNAQPRGVGKQGARAARREGNVPCVLYGHLIAPVVFQVPEKSLKPLVFTNETHLIKVELDGDAWECIVKDITFHPITDRPMHADFQVLQKGEKITLSVPVLYLGTPVGQTEGGHTNFLVHELEVSCLPKDIPSHLDIDISGLSIGDALHVGDLDVGDFEIHAPDDQMLVSVIRPRVVVEPVAEDLLLEGEEAAAEGEEGAEEPGED